MTLLHDRIGVIIETEICPDHFKKPVATVIDGNITLECCCVDFEIGCYLKIITMLRGEAEQAKQQLYETKGTDNN